jgi:hypothetical protein
MTLEWRRKPLKSLKTDPEMASRSITRMPHQIESGGGASTPGSNSGRRRQEIRGDLLGGRQGGLSAEPSG